MSNSVDVLQRKNNVKKCKNNVQFFFIPSIFTLLLTNVPFCNGGEHRRITVCIVQDFRYA